VFLDTTFCIDLMREQHRGEEGPATQKLQGLGSSLLFVSVFVLCELQAGARLSSHPKRELQKVERFSATLNVAYPDASFAVAYGEEEAFLRKKGTPVSTMDLLIGVTAKMRGLPLLTRNVQHFASIPGLVLETY
jgi:tRNA(fMet)-specific endonuclease VapC